MNRLYIYPDTMQQCRPVASRQEPHEFGVSTIWTMEFQDGQRVDWDVMWIGLAFVPIVEVKPEENSHS